MLQAYFFAGLSILLSTPEPAAASLTGTVPATQVATQVATEEPVQTVDPALERALATIEEHEIASDLRFLSSDELGGRGSPSPGQRIAARFLAARAERLGFQPAGDEGFFDRYQLAREALDLKHTAFGVSGPNGSLRLVPREDWWYANLPAKVDMERTGRLVYVGQGRGKDLEQLDLEGAFAIAKLDLEAIRESNEAQLDFRLRPIADAAEGKGALGTLFICEPGADLGSAADALDRRTANSFLGRLSEAGRPGRRVPNPGPLRVVLRPEASGALLGLLGLDALPSEAGVAFDATLTEERTAWKAEDGSNMAELENVAALLPGNDPKLRDQVIILSAHYDHLGGLEGRVWNGADDNGTGTTTMLAVAEALATYGGLDRSVLILWVSAEEHGLLGSRAWCADPTLPEGMRPIANLNIDMVGRNAPDQILLTPTKAMGDIYNGLSERLEKMAPVEGFEQVGSADQYYSRSDQESFQKAFDIPVAFLFADIHEDYHQETDDFENIKLDKVRRVARLATRALVGLQGAELNL